MEADGPTSWTGMDEPRASTDLSDGATPLGPGGLGRGVRAAPGGLTTLATGLAQSNAAYRPCAV